MIILKKVRKRKKKKKRDQPPHDSALHLFLHYQEFPDRLFLLVWHQSLQPSRVTLLGCRHVDRPLGPQCSAALAERPDHGRVQTQPLWRTPAQRRQRVKHDHSGEHLPKDTTTVENTCPKKTTRVQAWPLWRTPAQRRQHKEENYVGLKTKTFIIPGLFSS